MKKLVILTLLLISITCISSLAEPGNIGFGLTGGYLNASNDVHYAYNSESARIMDNFNKGSLFSGLVLELPIEIFFESSLITKLTYNSFSYFYPVMGDEYPSLVDDSQGGYTTVLSQTRWDWQGNYSLLSFELLPKIKIPFINLGIFAGISMGYVINSRYEEVYRFIKPDYVCFKVLPNSKYRYAENNRAIYLKEGEIPYKNSFRFAVKAGLVYDFDFWGIQLSPFLNMDFPISDVVNGVNMDVPERIAINRTNAHWRITYYQCGIDLKYLF